MTDPALRVLAAVEAEHRLAVEGRADELAAIQDERDAALAELPWPLGPERQRVLARALEIQQDTTALLAAARDEAAAALGRLDQGRTTLRAYTPAGVHGSSVDHSA